MDLNQRLYFYIRDSTVGARERCGLGGEDKDSWCRTANTWLALSDVIFSLGLFLLVPTVRRHIDYVSRKIDHARITVSDYSVELSPVPPDATPESIQQTVARSRGAKRRPERRCSADAWPGPTCDLMWPLVLHRSASWSGSTRSRL